MDQRLRHVLGALLLIVVFECTCVRADAFEHYITAQRGMLKDGAKLFRFISFNVPNLNYTEDDMRFTQTNPYRLPTEYEMRDAFATVRQMGGQVIRIYTIPVRSTDFPPNAPTYVLAPGKFNEEAFRSLDLMMALANEYGVRIVIPLMNNWPWMGGRPQYAAFRGKKPDAFWTDPQLIADVEATIRHLIERRNTITGVRYKDDKAILCWETGNELAAPFSWTLKITRFIKSLDHHHLVMDGSRGDAANNDPSVQPGAFTEPSIDIVTTHHYEQDPFLIPGHIRNAVKSVRHRKVYVVGEFGFASTAANEAILDEVIAAKHEVAGALLWSLRFHNSDGGYYWHSEPLGGDLYKSFYWPGSAAGETYDDARMMEMVRRKAYEIQDTEPPAPTIPETPKLLPIEDASAISWQGATGAMSYNVERATAAAGPWTLAAYNVSDADIPYFPLYQDTSARVGETYYYRVRALNAAGVSAPSNVVGPVQVTEAVIIDTMKNLGVAETSKSVSPTTGSDRSFKEIRNRLAGTKGAELIYRMPGRLNSFDFYAFEQSVSNNLQILGSPDGNNWRDLNVAPASYASGENNYQYWIPKLYRYTASTPLQFIKVVFKGGPAQLARARLTYLPK
jgi:hypothetical protein